MIILYLKYNNIASQQSNNLALIKFAKKLCDLGFDKPCVALFLNEDTLLLKDLECLESRNKAIYIF